MRIVLDIPKFSTLPKSGSAKINAARFGNGVCISVADTGITFLCQHLDVAAA